LGLGGFPKGVSIFAARTKREKGGGEIGESSVQRESMRCSKDLVCRGKKTEVC